MPGLDQSKPLAQDGHALVAAPVELFLRPTSGPGRDRLLGETENVAAGSQEGAKATFAQERVGVAGMALGIIERCLELSVEYANGCSSADRSASSS